MDTMKNNPFTEEQCLAFVEEEDKRLRSFLAHRTDLADRVATEEILSRFYQRIGRKPPEFRWLDGPSSCLAEAAADKKHLWDLKFSLELTRWLRIMLWTSMDKRLCAAFGFSEADVSPLGIFAVTPRLRAAQAEHPLEAALWSIWGLDADTHPGDVGRSVLTSGHLQAEPSAWAAHYLILGAVLDRTCQSDLKALYSDWEEVLNLWEQLGLVAGWWFPFENVCLCADRHAEVHLNDQHQLHRTDGPALVCRDGFEVFAQAGRFISQPQRASS